MCWSTTSSWVSVPYGISQGSILDPLLYLIYFIIDFVTTRLEGKGKYMLWV